MLARVAALALVASAALPLSPAGHSFLTLLRGEFGRGVLEGMLMLAGFGSPYLFAVVVALVPGRVPDALAARMVRVPLALLHSQLVLVALVVWLAGDALADLALLGFALVSGASLALYSARAKAEDTSVLQASTLRWYVRWGGMMVTAVAAWMELQRISGLEFGLALHVALGAGVAMVFSVARIEGARPSGESPTVPVA